MRTIAYCGNTTLHRSVLFLLLFSAAITLNLFMSPPANAQQSPLISGITEPIKDVTLGLSVPGIVSRILVKEGDVVKKGQSILHLDKRTEELEAARRKVIWESKAEQEGAKVRAKTLKEIYESTAELYDSTRSISTEELKMSELEYRLAVAEKERLDSAELREKIEYDMALEDLNKRTLKSPITGTVIKVLHEEGESTEEHQPLVRVVDTSRCRFVCNLDESLGRLLKKGREVTLMIGSVQDPIEKKGTVSFVSPVVDSASGLMEVKVEFDNSDGAVRPGLSANMEFDL